MMKSNFASDTFKRNQHLSMKIALVDDKTSLTFGELEKYARTFASRLAAKGLTPQQRIIFYFDDCVEWPTAFLACLLVGLNPVCVNHNNNHTRLQYLIDLVDAKAIITDSNLPFDANLQIFNKTEIFSDGEQYRTPYQYHDDEPCFWLLTSGTTGHPKAMVHRHSNLANYRDSTQLVYKLNQSSKVFSSAKLSFTFGLNVALTQSLPFGATVYLMHGPSGPSKILDMIETHGITNFFTVPTVINSILKHCAGRTISQTLKEVISGSESLPPVISKRFHDVFGIQIRNGLGMSELISLYFIQDLENYQHGSIGKPFPGIECKLLNESSEIVKDGEVGELYVKSPCMASLYWKDWQHTNYTFVGDWLRTGDKIKKLPCGNYMYISRIDDQIKICGQWVSSVELESKIMEVPNVTDCVVVFQIFEDSLPKIHAFVVKDIDNIDDAIIKNFLRDYLPAHKIPSHIHYVDEIPRTLTNKKIRYLFKNSLEK